MHRVYYLQRIIYKNVQKRVDFELQFAISKTNLPGHGFTVWNLYGPRTGHIHHLEPKLGSELGHVYHPEPKIGSISSIFRVRTSRESDTCLQL